MKKKRFIREIYKTQKDRHTCPHCKKPKCFSRDFDTETGEFVADHVGICNHRESCGYNYTGWDFIKDNSDYNRGKNFTPKSTYTVPKIETETKLPTYIDKALFTSTLGFNKANTLHRWLVNLFGQVIALYLIERFNIGTTSDGKAIMWRVDINGNILSSEIIEYVAKKSEETFTKTDCKRTKIFEWVHTHKDFKESFTDFEKSHCCFGEQYLNEGKPIYLVESAKTVLLASVYLPQYTWIACGSMGNFSYSFLFLNSLKDRDIYLMPDCGAGFIEWSKKAESKEMKAFFKSVTVDNRLQEYAFESENGFDIGDFLIRSAPPQFEIPAPAETLPAVATDIVKESTVTTAMQSCITDNYDVAITDLIANHDTPPGVEEMPFLEDLAKPDTPLTPLEIRAILVAEWFVTHGGVFDGTFILDNLAIPDIRKVIVHHLQIIDNQESSSVISVKFLERVKKAFTGCD
jgi:ribosomal protein L37AE/L43A